MKPTLQSLASVVRGAALLSTDATRLIIRTVVWVRLTALGKVPKPLRAEPAAALMSGRQLLDVFARIANADVPSAVRFVFHSLRADEYLGLSEHHVAALLDRVWAIENAGGIEQADFEEFMHRASLSDRYSELGFPLEVGELLVGLSTAGESQPVACVGEAAELVAIAAMRKRRRAVLRTRSTPMWASAYSILFAGSLDVIVADPLEMTLGAIDAELPYRCGIATPAFNVKHDVISHPRWMESRYGARFSHALYIELMLNLVTERIVAVVPNSFLFTLGREAKFREDLVTSGRLISVISFPAGLLYGVSMPFSVVVIEPKRTGGATTMCKVDEAAHVLSDGKERSRTKKLVHGDAVLKLTQRPELPHARKVPSDEIRSQDFVLTPERYLNSSKQREVDFRSDVEMVRLADLAATIRPQAWPPAKTVLGMRVREIGVVELPDFGYIALPDRERTVDAEVLNKRQAHILQEGDVLISVKGSIGKTGIVGADNSVSENPALRVASQSFLIVRLKRASKITDPVVLLMLLRSPFVQASLAAVTSASTVPVVQTRDVESLSIPVPSLEDQRRLSSAFSDQVRIEGEIALLRDRQRSVASDAYSSFVNQLKTPINSN